MRYLWVAGAFPLRVNREKVLCSGQSLLGCSMDPPTIWMVWWVPNGGTPERNSSMVRRQFSKLRSGKYQRLTNLIGKEPLLLDESAQWFFQLALPTANKSYQVSPGLLPVLPAEASLLCTNQTDCLREMSWILTQTRTRENVGDSMLSLWCGQLEKDLKFKGF